MARYSYEFQILVTPSQPLSHGAGNEGNVQVLRRTQRNVLVGGEWLSLDVPAVSGSALKATLREHAVAHYLDALGVPDGSMTRDGLRLLLKGGKVSAQGQGVQHDEIRRLRRLFPPLAVFGFMDGALTAPGMFQSCELVPYTVELREAGFFTGMDVALPPIPDAMTSAEVTYYRHDQHTSALGGRYLAGATQAAIEDARTARSGKVARKDERREANESMPHTFEVIPAGTPLVGTLRLTGAGPVDLACFTLALARWRQHGAHLGGGRGKGHGVCNVQMVRAVRLGDGVGPVPVNTSATLPVETVDLDGAEQVAAEYRDYVTSVRDEALALLRES
jgi:hypothetical protein